MSGEIKENRLFISAAVLLAALAMLWPGDAADAQENIRDNLLACEKISDQSNRADCFSAIVANLREGTAPEPDQATTPVADEPVATPAPEPVALPQPTSSGPASPADFGSESIRRKGSDAEAAAKKKSEEQLVANIASLRTGPYGHFIVKLDNGQVWRETDGSHVRLSKKHSKVEIFRGRFGGYRMRIEGIRKIAWVRRIK